MAAADEANKVRLEAQAKAAADKEVARQARMDQLKADREAKAAATAEARAKSNPLFDPTNRPEAPQDEPGFVKYYSWIGGGTTGQWKLYKEPADSPKAASAQARSTGGATQAQFGSSAGANTVPTPGAGGSATGGSSASGTNTKFDWMGAGDANQNNQTYTAPDGRIFTDLTSYNAYIAQTKADEKRRAGQSAYDLLFEQFNEFGLGGLVEPLKGFITEGLSPAEFTLRLRDTDAYKKRFAANQARIQKGLKALSEAEYINLEDQYQDVMRRYGLPESYYARGDMGRQEGFEKFIGGDVSPVELEDRIQTAQRRVINAAPQIKDALTQYYGNEISNGDILAYVLDPEKAIEGIKRKVTAAEIGAGAALAGLRADRARAEELGALGVTEQQARQGFQAIAEMLPAATKLGDIYAKQGLGPYTQTTAEQEVFGTAGAADAAQKRRKLTQLETAQFSGTSGTAGGALGRERAGQF